jgi:hypothetical protein
MKRRIIKLAPQVPAWCDAKNNIYLSKSGRKFKELKDDIDMKAINKGIKAGLIILEEHEEKEIKKVETPKEEPVAIEVKAKPESIAEKVKAKRAKKAVEPKEEEIKEEVVVEEENKDKEE